MDSVSQNSELDVEGAIDQADVGGIMRKVVDWSILVAGCVLLAALLGAGPRCAADLPLMVQGVQSACVINSLE